jgi:hypothetical protein
VSGSLRGNASSGQPTWWNGTFIPPPALDISAYTNPSTYDYPYYVAPTFPGDQLWVLNGTNLTESPLFNAEDMNSNGSCQPDLYYEWGFSFLVLFIFSALLLFWGVGTFFFWLKADLALKSYGRPIIAGDYRAALEMASILQSEFLESEQDLSKLTEKEIEAFIKDILKGGSIPHFTKPFVSEVSMRKALSRWWKGPDKWWILGLMISTGFLCSVTFTAPELSLGGMVFSLCLTSGIGTGILMALSISSSNGSRTIMTLFFISFAIVLGIILAPILGDGMYY